MVRKLKNSKIVISVSLILLVICAAFVMYDIDDSKVEVGLQEGLIEQVEYKPTTGTASIYMSTNIVLKDSKSPAKLLIQNNKNNTYSQKVRIVDRETEELYYESSVIDPGYKIEKDFLQKELPKGEYECLAKIDMLDTETYDLVNTVNIGVTIKVKS